MAVQRLFLLPAGRCLVDHSALDTRKSPGLLVDLPIWAYLIETSDGPVLVDTGMPERCAEDPEGYFRGTEDEGLIVPRMRTEDAIVPLLARAGYQPHDLQRSIDRLRDIARATGARIFFGHDPEQAGEWPVFPQGL
jgi:N-acyl homoserine lactone hydrolase